MKYANLEYCLEYKEDLKSLEEINEHISEGNSVYEELSEENKKIVESALQEGDSVEIGRVSVWESGQEFHNESTDHHYIFLHKQERIGIGYSDQLFWADVDSPKEGLDLFFRDREAFDARN